MLSARELVEVAGERVVVDRDRLVVLERVELLARACLRGVPTTEELDELMALLAPSPRERLELLASLT